jgi:histidinol-phosphatase (PHP family)
LRYVAGVEGITADPADYEERLRLLFAAMARSGKALEINTSGLRQRLGKTMPDAWCVRLFRDCGGEYLTLGSDAHRAADVGKGLAQAAALAEAQGFRYITYYKERRPAPIPIGKALGGILKGI